jgi:hypothetical protein
LPTLGFHQRGRREARPVAPRTLEHHIGQAALVQGVAQKGAIAEPIGFSVRSENNRTASLNACDSVNGLGICANGPGGS